MFSRNKRANESSDKNHKMIVRGSLIGKGSKRSSGWTDWCRTFQSRVWITMDRDGADERSVVSMKRNAGTHTECTIYLDGRIESATQLVMYMKDTVRGMGNTCHILTGCPIKRFGTSSPRPPLLRVASSTDRDSLYLANLNILEK